MRKSRRKKKNIRTYIGITISLSAVLLSILAACVCLTVKQKEKQTDRQIAPDELLLTYMNRISEQKYGQMYEMTDLPASGQIQKQDFAAAVPDGEKIDAHIDQGKPIGQLHPVPARLDDGPKENRFRDLQKADRQQCLP